MEELGHVLASSPDEGEKMDAAWRLGALGTGEAVRCLAGALKREQSPLVREAITGALLGCEPRAVAEEMAALLKSGEASAVSAAMEVLSACCSEDSLEVLERLLRDENRDVRVSVVHTLGKSNCASGADLFRRVISEDEDVNVVAAAVEYLGEVGEERDAELLRAAAERFKDPFLSFTVRRALEMLEN